MHIWSRNCQQGTDFSQNSWSYIILKHPHDPHASDTIFTHASLIFHWSELTTTQCLFFIGYSLHLPNAYFQLFTVYSKAFLVSSNYFVDFIHGRVYVLRNLPDSSQFKVKYYVSSKSDDIDKIIHFNSNQYLTSAYLKSISKRLFLASVQIERKYKY